jgi:hypothetical protein
MNEPTYIYRLSIHPSIRVLVFVCVCHDHQNLNLNALQDWIVTDGTLDYIRKAESALNEEAKRVAAVHDEQHRRQVAVGR